MSDGWPSCAKNWRDMKKVLFLHGFFASGSCVPAMALKQALDGKAEVLTPDLPIHPKVAIGFIRRICDKENPDLLVGNSCGSFLAQILAPIVGVPALLVYHFPGGHTPTEQEVNTWYVPLVEKMLMTFHKPTDGYRYFLHFKGGMYRFIRTALDSETKERMVVYQALYGENDCWVRPEKTFFGKVTKDGKTFNRFLETDNIDR